MNPKDADSITNSEAPDQTAHWERSDLGLHGLLLTDLSSNLGSLWYSGFRTKKDFLSL